MPPETINIIIAVIGSSVIAAIISSLFTLLVSSKQAKLEYITKERARWREEIRTIAVEVEECKIKHRDNVGNVMAKLKVRINAYGMNENSTDENDRYLWKRIEIIEGLYGRVGEKNFIDWEKLEEELDGLIDDLSMLLKDDWERSKREVSLFYRLKSWVKGRMYNGKKRKI